MLDRCRNPRNKSFNVYGARGIRVCDEWREYAAFRAWAVANGYRKGLTLDREDNDGNYEPGNCRWIGWHEQQQNTSRPRFSLTFNGVAKPLAVWAKELGIPKSVLHFRRRSGWTDEDVLTVPKNRGPSGYRATSTRTAINDELDRGAGE